MALRFQGGEPFLGQARASTFHSSLPATPPLRGSTNSRVSPHFKPSSQALGVRCAAGSKLSEALSVTLPAKHDDKEFPPLLASLVIPGIPPCHESPYVDESSAIIEKRWPSSWKEFESFYQAMTSFLSFNVPASVSADRLAIMSSIGTQFLILGDVLFDLPNAVLAEKIGIDPAILGSPEGLREFIHSMDVLIRQEESPQNPTPIQEMTWRLGCDLRELSNPEWFELFTQSALSFFLANLDCFRSDLEGDRRGIEDVDSYTKMRIQTTGGHINNLCIEFANNQFLPTKIRQRPAVQRLSLAHWTWGTYINDVFSFSKEQHDEAHAPKLIKVIMESEGLSLPQTAWRAVNLTNSLAREILELETELLDHEGAVDPALRRYVGGTKESMSGNLHWHSMVKRYRHPQAAFSELRDINVSFFPRAEPYKCMK